MLPLLVVVPSLRRVQEAAKALALDGILFNGVAINVKRPSNYQKAVELGACLWTCLCG